MKTAAYSRLTLKLLHLDSSSITAVPIITVKIAITDVIATL